MWYDELKKLGCSEELLMLIGDKRKMERLFRDDICRIMYEIEELQESEGISFDIDEY